MQYTIEELSSCRKKVNVTAEPAEVDAAIDAAVAMQRKGIALDGFRKGHVPAAIIEKRFKGQLYHDACQDLINVHINQVMGETSLSPVGGIDMNGNPAITRGKALEYSFQFEHLPVFDLPPYEGLEVEQEERDVTEDEVDAVLLRIRNERAKFVPVDGADHADDGQYANIDLDVIIDGKPVPGISSQGYDLLVGQKTVLPELDELVKSIAIGGKGEREVTFPEDFLNPELAGKTAVLRIAVHAVKARELAPLDETLFSSFGVADEASLRKVLAEQVRTQFVNLYRSNAQTKLLEGLLTQVDFDLPQSLVDVHMNNALGSQRARYERMGKSMTKEEEEAFMAAHLEEIRKQVKSTVLLMAVARKEGRDVADREVETVLYQQAHRTGMDPQALFEYYRKTGLVFHLRDSLLADKGMNAIYEKAKVTLVPAAVPAPTGDTPAEPAASGE